MFISAAFGAVVGVAHSALEHLATLLTPVAGGLAGAVAIVVFTLLVRLLISPLTYLQVRAERRRAALAPQLDELRRKHQDDRVALATETLAVQRAAGVGPFVSLLPGLAQAPFFMIMFRLVHPAAAVVTGLLAGALLGVPLTAHLFASASGVALFAVLLALGVALAWWNSRRIRRTQAVAVDNAAKLSDPRATVGPPNRGRGAGASKPAVGQKPAVGPKRAPGTGSAADQKRSGVQKAPANSTPAGNRAGSTATRGTTGRVGAAPVTGTTGRAAAGRAATTSPGAAQAGEGVAAAMARVMPWMPYLTVAVMAYLPLAGALYLLTSTAWTALEHAIWRRPRTISNQ